MKKKIFAVSDIHGNYHALINALEEAGFDENNDSHLLVVLGLIKVKQLLLWVTTI